MQYLSEILLAIIAAEGAYIAFYLRGGRLPWLVNVDNGNLEGETPKAADARSLEAQLDYLGCALRLALEADNQRHEKAADQG
ncbi:MAG: hypothetical protein AAF657_17335 [Acidobacteriota bacterium]